MIYLLTGYLILLAIDRMIMARRVNAIHFAFHLLVNELRSNEVLSKDSIDEMARTFEHAYPNDKMVRFK